MLEVKVIVRGQGYVSGVEVVLPGDECDGLVHVLSGAHNGPPDDSDSDDDDDDDFGGNGGNSRWQTMRRRRRRMLMLMMILQGQDRN